jgi:ABC-2 type transport system ATP-binding protein
MLVGMTEPSHGWFGLDGVSAGDDTTAYKRRLGYVPEEAQLYQHLTAAEYLRLVGRLRGLPARLMERRIDAFLGLMLLREARDQAIAGYSKGMRQRVLLSAALMHNPDLLVLDEPFSGLDVDGSALLLALLRALAAHGKMVLFSSHRLNVVERICERIIILHRGHVVADQPAGALRTSESRQLEDLFAVLTDAEDYTARVESIMAAMTLA